MMRQGLCGILHDCPNIEVVGEAGDGDEAVTATSKLQPTVVLMDINMGKMDGITATRLIKARHPDILVIGLSVYPKDDQVYAMQKAGAYAVVSKEKALYELSGAIQRAVASTQPVLVREGDIVSANSLPKMHSLDV